MSKEKLIENFRNKFGLNGLHAKPVEYMDYEDVTEEVVKEFGKAIAQTREETIREVEEIVEEITPAYIGVLESNNDRRYYEQGFGEYKEEIKQSLKSLINKPTTKSDNK